MDAGGRRRGSGEDRGDEPMDLFFDQDQEGFAPEPGDEELRPARPQRPRPRRRGVRRAAGGRSERVRRAQRQETRRRVVVALPWIVFAIVITAVGDGVFAAAMVGLALVGLREYFLMVKPFRPFAALGFMTAAALILAAYFGTAFNIILIGAAAFGVMFFFAAERERREHITLSMAVTVLGVAWIGIPLFHAVLLRQLPLHGGALLIDVLVGTFVTDTAAYATGRMFGRRPIAPSLSPHKTLEGLVGGFLIGTIAFWFASLYQDWLPGGDALIMGACIAALAPIGDLFESMIKRDLALKDTGQIFGPHGGLLDRLDAVFFTVVAGYYLSIAFVY